MNFKRIPAAGLKKAKAARQRDRQAEMTAVNSVVSADHTSGKNPASGANSNKANTDESARLLRHATLDAAFGMFKGKDVFPQDGLEFQDEMRAEWR